MQNAIYIGTYYKVRLVAPFTYKSKADIVELGIKLGAPLHLTWSCYEGGAVACGICPTCIGRLEAFRSLGQTDPIEYEFDKWRQSNHQRQIANASVQLNAALAQSERERHGTE
jgi:7-cyano-7-deazaguanine synthase in queuosine biosynthesis